MLVDGGIEPRSPSSDGHLRITDPTMLEAFRARSREQLEDLIDRIASQGVNLLVVREGIDDLAVAPLREAGIVAYRRVDRSDLDLLARATGAKVVHDSRTVNTDDFGAFDSSDAMDIGGRMHWILRAEHGRGATLFIRGSTEEVLDEVERCFDDALGVATGLVSEGTAVPGAGATHIAIARHLRREASRVEGRSQLAVEAWADALEVIPRARSLRTLDGIQSMIFWRSMPPKPAQVALPIIARWTFEQERSSMSSSLVSSIPTSVIKMSSPGRPMRPCPCSGWMMSLGRRRIPPCPRRSRSDSLRHRTPHEPRPRAGIMDVPTGMERGRKSRTAQVGSSCAITLSRCLDPGRCWSALAPRASVAPTSTSGHGTNGVARTSTSARSPDMRPQG